MTMLAAAPLSESKTSTRLDYHGLIQTAWGQFRNLAEAQQRKDLILDLTPVLDRFDLGIFRLVVMGEIKKGKSSFINALLGEPDLLPTASDVATATVFKIMYGPERRFKVFFLPDVDTDRRPEPKVIEASDLRDYGTEAGNRGNQRRVDFIGLELPHPLLREGLVIVDTPGVGGLFKAHRDITWRYAPNADAICFVLDSVESVISNDELAFLKELTQKVTRKIFFVQTKTDAADVEQWRGWEKRNREHLAKHLGIAPGRLLYFPVSAKRKGVADKQNSAPEKKDQEKALRSLDRSGFAAVLKFLSQGLMEQKGKLLAQQTARQLLAAGAELEHQNREQLRIAQTQSKEELDKIAAELAETEKALVLWERETYPGEMRRFEDEFSKLRLHISGRLRIDLDSAVSVTEIINQLHLAHPDAEVLNEQAGALQQEMLARASEAALRIEQEFNEQAVRLIEATADRLAKGYRVARSNCEIQPMGMPIPVADTLHMKFTTYEKVQRGMMGLGVGLGLASLLTVVFPPAAAIAGLLAIAGGLFGGKKGLEQLAEQKRTEAIGKLQQRLTETMMRAGSQAQQHFAEGAQQLEQFARNTFEAAAKRSRTDLQSRLRDVQAARTRTGQEAQAKTRELQSRAGQLAELAKLLAPLNQPTPNAAPA
jgi:GTP-binding protein EngB required for normal cell division